VIVLRYVTAAAIACLLLATPASPAVIHVDDSGGGDYLTIQEGIAAASEGDTLLVAPGTYTGPLNRGLDFGGTNIVLRGTAGPDSTIIDCGGADRGFHFHTGETASSVLEGFTITHGYAGTELEPEGSGGGILCENASSPTITGVVFLENDGYWGGGITCESSSAPSLANCSFLDNTSHEGGGMLCMSDPAPAVVACLFTGNSGWAMTAISSSPVVTGCTFTGNHGGAINGYGGGSPRLEDCVVSGNSGWGSMCTFCDPTIVGCTFSENSAGGVLCLFTSSSISNTTFSNNGGHAIMCQEYGLPTITNCIMAFSGGHGVYCEEGLLVQPTVTHSCVFGNAGGDSLCGDYYDNIFEDPLFCDAAGGDFTLHADSPCLPQGNPWYELLGAQGQGCGPVVTTWYVDCDNISGIEDGSEKHPFNAIGEGIAASSEGDTVLVAPGLYSGPWNRDLDFGGVNRILRSTAGPESTVIDCADSGRVFLFQSGEGPSSVVDGLTVSNTNPDIMGSGIYCQGSSPTLTNLVLYRTGGLYCDQASPSVANVDFHTNYWFSGMRCVNNSSPTLTGATFADSFDGGLVCIDSSPTLNDVVFEDHDDWGYAMRCTGNSDAVLTNVMFERNDGGGLYCSGATPTLTNVTFQDNGDSYAPAGGIYCEGGAPALDGVTFTENRGDYAGGMACVSGCSASLTDVTFSGNSGGNAGGMYCGQSSPSLTGVDFDGNAGVGGGVYCRDQAHPVLDHVTISNSEGLGMYCAQGCSPVLTSVMVDSSSLDGLGFDDDCDVSLTNVAICDNQGCGMSVSHSCATLTDVIFSGNHSAGYGGGLRCVVADVTLADVTFDGNSSDAQGGGVFATGSWFSGGTTLTLDRVTFSRNSAAAGGAMFLDEYSRGSMTNSTLSENAAALGGGIYCAEQFGFDITNTIIAFNGGDGGIYCAGGYTPTTTHSCIYGNAGGDSLCGDYYDNMFLDPSFCTDELTLRDDSPCLPQNNAWGELVGAYGAGGCGTSSVDGSFYADADSPESVMLRWTVASLSGIEWFNVYRATSPDGPFVRVNEEPIPPASPGEYEDSTVWPQTTFWYELRAALAEGVEDVVGPALANVTTEGQLVFTARPAIPNPFAAETRITFDIPDHAGPVSLAIYNVRGQVVRTLIDGIVDRGRHTVSWNAADSAGRRVSAGVYFARLVLGGAARSQKLVVVR
jgi:hypothetical protein